MSEDSGEVLQALKEMTQQQQQLFTQLQSLDSAALLLRPAPNKWNAIECIEHLCYYGDFYIPEIKSRLASNTHKTSTTFSSGWLGNKFARMMQPDAKSMKTLKSTDPTGKTNATEQCFATFQGQLQAWMEILDHCATANLTKTTVKISISNFLKLRLGDALRVNVYHIQRHLEQAIRSAGTKA